ncbi:hypothetical protein ACLMAL_30520 [Nocardia sp. CWNU-33]|uniref:hypothetical protein n=1 Tax=Nocardia sp. CWNU-33 TaxID=3392117 RepID=UPI00398F34F0
MTFDRISEERRLDRHAGLFPWQWTPEEGEAPIDHLRSGSASIAMSAARNYEVSIGVFLAFVRDSRYRFAETRSGHRATGPRRHAHHDQRIRFKIAFGYRQICRTPMLGGRAAAPVSATTSVGPSTSTFGTQHGYRPLRVRDTLFWPRLTFGCLLPSVVG